MDSTNIWGISFELGIVLGTRYMEMSKTASISSAWVNLTSENFT